MQEIPSSFLFNNCVKFYLTDRNNEDMEGFNDVWANILNDDLLNAKDLNNVPLLLDSRSTSLLHPGGISPNNPLENNAYSETSQPGLGNGFGSSTLQPRLLSSQHRGASPSL
jgi:hypothetical protein